MQIIFIAEYISSICVQIFIQANHEKMVGRQGIQARNFCEYATMLCPWAIQLSKISHYILHVINSVYDTMASATHADLLQIASLRTANIIFDGSYSTSRVRF
jgi:hypothetical protein